MDGVLKARTIHYILERQCEKGGFCFYRLEEPNGADTYYALVTLHLLGERIYDPASVQFLKDAQAPGGSYHNLYRAYYAIKGLRYLGSRPRHDPRPYLEAQLRHFAVENASSETALKRLDLLTELCLETGVEISPAQRREITAFIHGFSGENGGFGSPVPTLLVTAYAVKILSRLGLSLPSLKIERYLAACEHPLHGFLNVPDMAPSFLEHIHAGLSVSRFLKHPPRYPDACQRFIERCQAPNGGFARTSCGLPGLADTYLAIHALTILEDMEKIS